VLSGNDFSENLLPVANAELDNRIVRHRFIRKVYLILTAQLFVAVGVCALLVLHVPTRHFVIGNSMPLFYINIAIMLGLAVALSKYEVSKDGAIVFGVSFFFRNDKNDDVLILCIYMSVFFSFSRESTP